MLALCLALWPLASGCAEASESEPPTLSSAEFEDPQTVLLHFSEPMAAPASELRASKFRLSAGFLVDGVTVYFDIADHFTDGPPDGGADGSTEGTETGGTGADPGLSPRHSDTRIVGVEAVAGMEDALRLRLSVPLEPYVCDAVAHCDPPGERCGIFVHYDDSDAPRVEDRAGNPLASIGAAWTSDPHAAEYAGEFPDHSPRISLDCPDDVPYPEETG
jgi:hypothetical protein